MNFSPQPDSNREAYSVTTDFVAEILRCKDSFKSSPAFVWCCLLCCTNDEMFFHFLQLFYHVFQNAIWEFFLFSYGQE